MLFWVKFIKRGAAVFSPHFFYYFFDLWRNNKRIASCDYNRIPFITYAYYHFSIDLGIKAVI